MRTLALAAAIAVLYWGTGVASRMLSAGDSMATAVWPPTGVLLAAVIGLGAGAVPAALAGAFVGSLAYTGSLLAASGLAAGNVAGALASAAALRRLPAGWTLYSPQGLLALALIACLSSALSASLSLSYQPDWWKWWGANTISVVALAPALIYWREHPSVSFGRWRAAELAALVGCSGAVFAAVFGHAGNLPVGYAALPALAWAGVRFGLRETATLLAAATFTAAWGTARGLGPFPESPVLAQTFIAIGGLMSLALAAAWWQLKDASRRLAEGQQRLRLAAEAGDIGTWDWDLRADDVRWDRRYRALFGFGPDEPLRREDLEARVHPDDRERWRGRLLAALDPRGDGRYRNEFRLLLPDGTLRWISSRGRATFQDGRPVSVTGVAADITERKLADRELERRVCERTEELRRANEELEAFTHSLSHDMRASLRKVAVFRELLLKDPRTRLGPEGRRYAERIGAAVDKMRAVLEGLLRLAAVGRAAVRRQPLDLSAMARDLGEELAAAYPDCRVDFVVEPGLRVRGDPVLVEDLLRHLLENAWKFTCRVPRPRVELGCKDGRFYVKDNGPGFEMPFSEKVFAAFERLHAVEGVPGVGVGLALVRRAVERHGGRVWAEAKVGEGATFYFTLGEGS